MFEKEADFAETKMLVECKGDYSKKKDYKKVGKKVLLSAITRLMNGIM